MHWVAHDTEFLRETLANTIKVDEFTRNLFKIHERILAENNSAQVSIGLCADKIKHFVIFIDKLM